MTPKIRYLIAMAVLVATSAAAQTPSPSYTISFTQGKQACQIVHFPEAWISEPLPKTADPEMDELTRSLNSEYAVFRSGSATGPGGIMVTVEDLADRKSPQKYLLSLDPSITIKKISDDDWNGGAFTHIERNLWKTPAKQGLSIEPLGDSAASMTEVSTRLSSDRKWAAMFRWQGRLGRNEKGVPSKRLAPSIGPVVNEYSLEIADAAAERRVVVAKGRFNGVSTMYVTDSYGWITDRIFWMPFDNNLRDILVCDSSRFK